MNFRWQFTVDFSTNDKCFGVVAQSNHKLKSNENSNFTQCSQRVWVVSINHAWQQRVLCHAKINSRLWSLVCERTQYDSEFDKLWYIMIEISLDIFIFTTHTMTTTWARICAEIWPSSPLSLHKAFVEPETEPELSSLTSRWIFECVSSQHYKRRVKVIRFLEFTFPSCRRRRSLMDPFSSHTCWTCSDDDDDDNPSPRDFELVWQIIKRHFISFSTQLARHIHREMAGRIDVRFSFMSWQLIQVRQKTKTTTPERAFERERKKFILSCSHLSCSNTDACCCCDENSHCRCCWIEQTHTRDSTGCHGAAAPPLQRRRKHHREGELFSSAEASECGRRRRNCEISDMSDDDCVNK